MSKCLRVWFTATGMPSAGRSCYLLNYWPSHSIRVLGICT